MASLRAIEEATEIEECITKRPDGWRAERDAPGHGFLELYPPAWDYLSRFAFSVSIGTTQMLRAVSCSGDRRELEELREGVCIRAARTADTMSDLNSEAVLVRYRHPVVRTIGSVEGVVWTEEGGHRFSVRFPIGSAHRTEIGDEVPRALYFCNADDSMNREDFDIACRTFIEASTLDEGFFDFSYCG